MDGIERILEEKACELRRLSHRAETIIEALPNGIIAIDESGRITLCNAETERLFGYSRAELIGQAIEVLLPASSQASHPRLRDSFFKSPQKRAMGAGRDLFARRKDGSEFPIEIGLNPLQNDEGLFVLASVVDITERKAAEERFRAVVESAPNALLIVDERGCMTLVNSQAELMFGYGRMELMGKPIEMLVPQRFRAPHPAYREGFFHAPQARPMGAGRDLFGLHRDGREVPLEIGLKPLEINGKRHVLAAIVDISERKHIDAKLKQTNVELQQKNQEMEQFIYTVSHDLKTPIVTSMSFIQFMREDLPPDAAPGLRDSLDRIEKANRRMAQLIGDLLRLSRVGRIELKEERIDVSMLVTEIAGDLAERLRSLEADLRIEPAMPVLFADRGRISQLFENLLTNALKYGVGQAPLRIDVGSAFVDSELRYFVRDNGSGIAPEFHERIFGLFERLETDKEGTGVGLAIVSRVAQLHAGRAWVESVPGEGATFWIGFPLSLNRPE